MPIILSHISALEYWRSVRAHAHNVQEAPYAKLILSAPQKLKAEDAKHLSRTNSPLHILTGKAKHRRFAENVIYHVWLGQLPKGSVFDSGEGFLVCSPELCFLQMANHLSLPKLIELGFELCGTYDVLQETFKVQPLTAAANLESFVSSMNNINGIKKACDALPYIADNSASPMETILTMLLCLSRKKGGYGIDKPLLNHRIDLNPRYVLSTQAQFYICDLYWPKAKLDVEYDSNLFHAGVERMAYDSTRRSDLASLGITTISVTSAQLKNRAEMDKFAGLIAKRTGKRLTPSKISFMTARTELRNTLLSPQLDKMN